MLVGRQEELTRLTGAIAGRTAIVVSGEAGVGRTALCTSALGQAGHYLATGGLSTLRNQPLIPFRRLLHDDVEDPTSTAERVVVLGAPALLLDDLQWADATSFDVIDQLVGLLALVATVRTSDPDADGALRRLAGAGFDHMHLDPLGPGDSAALIDALHPGQPRPRSQSILALAAGNPQLIVELPTCDPAAGTFLSPSAVRALNSRLMNQSEPVRDAAHRLSLLGGSSALEALGPGADALVLAGFANRVDGRVGVREPLLVDAVVSSLTAAEIAETRRVLVPLVARPDGARLLSALGDRAAARALALEAADDASSRLEEAELRELAVECAEPDDLDPVNRIAAARLLSAAGLTQRARSLCQVGGVESLPPRERGGIRVEAARAAWLSDRPDDFASLIAGAIDDLRGTDTEEEVLALAGSTYVQTRIELDGRPALSLAKEAVALADQLGVQQAFTRMRLASVLLTAGESGWDDLFREAIGHSTRTAEHGVRISALQSLMLGQWLTGDLDDAVETAESTFAEGPPPDAESAWLALVAHGSLLAVLAGTPHVDVSGRWTAWLAEGGSFRNRAYAIAAVALANADRSRFRAAYDVLDGAVDRSAQPDLSAVLAWARSEVLWLAGRPADAVESAQAVEELGLGDFPPVVHARLVGAHAGLALGIDPRGVEPRAALAPWEGAPHEWRGLVASAQGDHSDAIRHYDRAAERWSGFDRRSELRVRLAAAESALLAGRDHDAVDRFTAVEARATSIHQAPMGARARRSLRSLGVAIRSQRGGGPGGLTNREVEVLQLVANGLTSAEIAAQLRVSVSTVDRLVGSAVRRLGVANRRTAAAVLRERHGHSTGRP